MIGQILGYLLRAAPPALHIIIAARRAPTFAPIARLRAESRLLELSQRDLLLSADDARQGFASVGHDFNEAAERDLQRSEVGPLPLAMIILVLVFGAIVAALLPIILAAFAIIVAIALTAIIGQQYQFSFFVTNMIVMMGLAVGIDYCLFIISRYREERGKGLNKLDALALAGGTAAERVMIGYDSAAGVTFTPVGGAPATVLYADAGQPGLIRDALGRTTRYGFDDLGRTAAVTAPTGLTTEFRYNAFGQPVSVTDPLGRSATFRYAGPFSELASYTDAKGTTTGYELLQGPRIVGMVDVTNDGAVILAPGLADGARRVLAATASALLLMEELRGTIDRGGDR